MSEDESEAGPDEYDSPWKGILKRYFDEFIDFFLPVAHDDIDWSRGHEFLDQEWARIARSAASQNRRVDQLVKVWLIDGQEQWVLIHGEVQGDRDGALPERMFTSHYRVYDLYRRPVIGVVILTDDDPNWRPMQFRFEKWGCEVFYRFNSLKLLDYLDRLDVLESSRNPFAVVTWAHLTARSTRKQPEERYRQKWRITRSLYQRGFTRQQIIDLFWFIDWVLQLPQDLEQRYYQEIRVFEEGAQVQYITSVERIGLERGMAQGMALGMEKGIQEGMMIGEQRGRLAGERRQAEQTLLRLLTRRFGSIPLALDVRLRGAELASLERWTDRVLDANSLEEVFA
ncbi:MAG: DUF4351 domain-containing protein [Magnetococcales bacterium]|nr:DUF4351 domain-containing protein [Magnetococcales bacterium]NGZ07316.1 DUF4351 domain-containing protein [Magnetococcales bacterium]